MKSFRPVIATLVALAVLSAAPSASALCIRCISSECWASIYASASTCHSYGSSCLTSGSCFSGGGGGGGGECLEYCWFEQSFAEPAPSTTPLALEYALVDVKIERPKTATAWLAEMPGDAVGKIK